MRAIASRTGARPVVAELEDVEELRGELAQVAVAVGQEVEVVPVEGFVSGDVIRTFGS
jgi:hypothetical protein